MEHIEKVNKEWEDALPGISGPIREVDMDKDRNKDWEVIRNRIIQSLPGGWNSPDAWTKGNIAIEASPLIHMLSDSTGATGHPEDPYEDVCEADEVQMILEKGTGLTEHHILTNLFRKEATCMEYVNLCERSEKRGISGIGRVTVTNLPNPTNALPPRWLMEIGESIWLEAARKWQGLLAANLRAEAIQVRTEIVELKIEIMNRFPETYQKLCSSAFRRGTRNLKTRIPPEQVYFIRDENTPILEFLREESALTESEQELIEICMNPKEPLESLGTPERSSSPEQTKCDTPSPMQSNFDLQALSFISEGSEVLSTPIQPRDADQPPVGVDETGANGMGGTSPMSDTEIGPTTEEPPNLTPSLELAQRTPQPQESEPPQVDERNILDISLPFDASLDTAPTPAQEDRIGACHELIDRVVEVIKRMENVLNERMENVLKGNTNPPPTVEQTKDTERSDTPPPPASWQAFQEHKKKEREKKVISGLKKKNNRISGKNKVSHPTSPPPSPPPPPSPLPPFFFALPPPPSPTPSPPPAPQPQQIPPPHPQQPPFPPIPPHPLCSPPGQQHPFPPPQQPPHPPFPPRPRLSPPRNRPRPLLSPPRNRPRPLRSPPRNRPRNPPPSPPARPNPPSPEVHRKNPWDRGTKRVQGWEDQGNGRRYRRAYVDRGPQGRENRVRRLYRGKHANRNKYREERSREGPQRYGQDLEYGNPQGYYGRNRGKDRENLGIRGNSPRDREVRGGKQWQRGGNGQQGWKQ